MLKKNETDTVKNRSLANSNAKFGDSESQKGGLPRVRSLDNDFSIIRHQTARLCPQFQSQFKDTITERGGKSMLAQSPNSTCKCGKFCVWFTKVVPFYKHKRNQFISMLNTKNRASFVLC